MLGKNTNPSNEYYLIDKYVINDGITHQFAVICPGGGYFFVSLQKEGISFAEKLNEMGISAFIICYRVKEKAIYPAPMDDLAHGIRDIFNNIDKYHLDPSNYSIWGSSAGAHLASSFGTENMGYKKYNLPKPNALILCYPVVTMTQKYAHQGSHDMLLGDKPTEEMENFASIEKNVTKNFPPTFLWCGDNDQIVDPENSKMLAEQLKKFDVPHNFEIYPDVAHGVGLGVGTNAEGWIEKAVDFWMKQK